MLLLLTSNIQPIVKGNRQSYKGKDKRKTFYLLDDWVIPE